jgi:hypothetical protein
MGSRRAGAEPLERRRSSVGRPSVSSSWSRSSRVMDCMWPIISVMRWTPCLARSRCTCTVGRALISAPRKWILPATTVSGLLISWAVAFASIVTDRRFSASRSAVSRRRRSLMSRRKTRVAGAPSHSTTDAVASIKKRLPSRRRHSISLLMGTASPLRTAVEVDNVPTGDVAEGSHLSHLDEHGSSRVNARAPSRSRRPRSAAAEASIASLVARIARRPIRCAQSRLVVRRQQHDGGRGPPNALL